MAVTSIWAIHGDVRTVLTYVGNDAKTTQPPDYSESELQGLKDVMDYAMNGSKTEQQRYVSGINCDPAIAREQMVMTKTRFRKLDGRTAFHGYQSFAPGEVTPELAHEIGKKLAEALWGESFQVVVATHLDKKHVHNHYVINSVSFTDGHKFHRSPKCYDDMRKMSDSLCIEYGLSVIQKPMGKGKHYAEWNAEKAGDSTWRGLIRQDVDKAIANAMTMTQFFTNLKAMGYELKTGVKHIAVRPQGKERFVRLRSLGENYTEEAIKQRILAPKTQARSQLIPALAVRRRYIACMPTRTRVKLKGLRALYFYYLYRLGVISKRRPSSKRMTFLLREDLMKTNRYIGQMKILQQNHIDTLEQLQNYMQSADGKLHELYVERKRLRNLQRTEKDPSAKKRLSMQASAITLEVKPLRSELLYCRDIETDAVQMRQKLVAIQLTTPTGKEVKQHEQRIAGR